MREVEVRLIMDNDKRKVRLTQVRLLEANPALMRVFGYHHEASGTDWKYMGVLICLLIESSEYR